MNINPPSVVRQLAYIVSVFVNASMGVLIANNVELSVWVLAVIAGFNAVVALMASINITPDQE